MKQWTFKKQHEKANYLRIQELAKLRERKKQILKKLIDKEVLLHFEKPLVVLEGTFTSVKVTICSLGEAACQFTPHFHHAREKLFPIVVNSVWLDTIIGIEAV